MVRSPVPKPKAWVGKQVICEANWSLMVHQKKAFTKVSAFLYCSTNFQVPISVRASTPLLGRDSRLQNDSQDRFAYASSDGAPEKSIHGSECFFVL